MHTYVYVYVKIYDKYLGSYNRSLALSCRQTWNGSNIFTFGPFSKTCSAWKVPMVFWWLVSRYFASETLVNITFELNIINKNLPWYLIWNLLRSFIMWSWTQKLQRDLDPKVTGALYGSICCTYISLISFSLYGACIWFVLVNSRENIRSEYIHSIYDYALPFESIYCFWLTSVLLTHKISSLRATWPSGLM